MTEQSQPDARSRRYGPASSPPSCASAPVTYAATVVAVRGEHAATVRAQLVPNEGAGQGLEQRIPACRHYAASFKGRADST